MAERTRKRMGQVIKILFEILVKYPAGLQAEEAFVQMRDSGLLTDYETAMYDSGSGRFEKIVHSATVDCVKAGWLSKFRGRWVVTDSGKMAYEKEWSGGSSCSDVNTSQESKYDQLSFFEKPGIASDLVGCTHSDGLSRSALFGTGKVPGTHRRRK